MDLDSGTSGDSAQGNTGDSSTPSSQKDNMKDTDIEDLTEVSGDESIISNSQQQTLVDARRIKRKQIDLEVDSHMNKTCPCASTDTPGNGKCFCVSKDSLTTRYPKCKHESTALSADQEHVIQLPTPGQAICVQTNHDGYYNEFTREPQWSTEVNKSSPSRQTVFNSDEDQPDKTILSVSSQPLFIPSTTDTSISHKQYQLKTFLSQHANNNHVTESSFMVHPASGLTADYFCLRTEKGSYLPQISESLTNGWAHSELNPENYPLIQFHDAVSSLPTGEEFGKHVFFSHCPEDREWVEDLIARLEVAPHNYSCAYTSLQNQPDPLTLQEHILRAARLSDRIVIVLSSRYVEGTWPLFEKTLKQLSSMNVYNQRMMAVLLEDCEIPESLGELCFLDSSNPNFFNMFTQRLQTSVTNGTILTFCPLHLKAGWNSFLVPADVTDIPSPLSVHGTWMEKAEFVEIVTKVSAVIKTSNKLPWMLSVQPLALLLLAFGLWLPAFIAILVIHVDDDTGIALPTRLTVFLFPLGLVAGSYFIKWRRSYWLIKIARLLVQNCVDVNQAFYFQGRPLFITACHMRTNVFAIYFVYFDATDCVRSVDLLLFTCMEDDWEKLLQLITFYTRDENYLSRMSLSERLVVMMSAPYLVKFVKQVLPHPPSERHVPRVLCLCQFTEECISRFAHGIDREDVPGLAELFTRHMPGKVSGSAVRRVQEELFHASHGLVP